MCGVFFWFLFGECGFSVVCLAGLVLLLFALFSLGFGPAFGMPLLFFLLLACMAFVLLGFCLCSSLIN